jgi:hypothetical protein
MPGHEYLSDNDIASISLWPPSPYGCRNRSGNRVKTHKYTTPKGDKP